MFKLIIFIITILAIQKAESDVITVSVGDYVYKIPKSYKYIIQTEDGIFLKKGNKYYLLKGYWGVFESEEYINKKYLKKITPHLIKKYILPLNQK